MSPTRPVPHQKGECHQLSRCVAKRERLIINTEYKRPVLYRRLANTQVVAACSADSEVCPGSRWRRRGATRPRVDSIAVGAWLHMHCRDIGSQYRVLLLTRFRCSCTAPLTHARPQAKTKLNIQSEFCLCFSFFHKSYTPQERARIHAVSVVYGRGVGHGHNAQSFRSATSSRHAKNYLSGYGWSKPM
jgi:hypothetical protein